MEIYKNPKTIFTSKKASKKRTKYKELNFSASILK